MNTLELLRTLVAFDTTSHRSNLQLIAWVAEYLQGLGARVTLVHNEDRTKANLLASIGPDAPGGIVLSGHTDVVPAADQDWASDPFVLREHEGRLHGRGSADMKAFLAACLAALPAWRGLRLQRPLHLAFSYDEEVGCLGVPSLVRALQAGVAQPALAIIGEPTQMRIGLKHRGFYGHRSLFRGLAAHSSDPGAGASAIEPASYLAWRLAALRLALREQRNGTTINVGRIDGGNAINVVPAACEVLWEFRPPDEPSAAFVRAEVDRILAGLPRGVTVESTLVAAVPPLATADADGAVGIVRALGGVWPPADLPFGTEAGYFQQAGIPAIVCGPGSIAQAHQPDEWVAVEELAAADRFLARVGAWAASEGA